MAFDIAKEHLEKMGLGGRIHTFEVSSATVELAARAVGCEPARIAKTLSFMVQGSPILVVAAGDAKVDNHKYKEKFHTKAKMLTPEEAGAGGPCGGRCLSVLCQGRGQGVSGPVAAAVRYCLSGLRQPQQRSQAHSGGTGTALGRRMV